MILGIGVDIVETARFQRFMDDGNQRLLDRLFTNREQECCRPKKGKASCLAARFAAKEAFLKALGTGLSDGISWHDVEVVNDMLGKPELRISGRAEVLFLQQGSGKSFLSLSHDGGNAVAMVVLEAA